MTSMPASRRARAMIFAPRSWPSRPGFAMTTLIFRVTACEVYGGRVCGSVHRAVEPEAPPAPLAELPRLRRGVDTSLRARRPDGDTREAPFHQRRLGKPQKLGQRTEGAQRHVHGLARTIGLRQADVADAPQRQGPGLRTVGPDGRSLELALRLRAVCRLRRARGTADPLGGVGTAERDRSGEAADDDGQDTPSGDAHRNGSFCPEGHVADSFR